MIRFLTLLAFCMSLQGATVVSYFDHIRSTSIPLSVDTFGAKGDGFTDDTAAFTNALYQASSLGASLSAVYVPPGTYLVGDLVFPGGTISLVGGSSQFSYDGSVIARTVLKAKPGTTNVLNTVNFTNAPNILIQNITVDGNHTATTGIQIAGATVLKQVTVMNCVGQGILGHNLNSSVLDMVSCVSNDGYGMVVTNDIIPSTKFDIHSCIFRSNGFLGLALYEGNIVNLTDCLFESNTKNGVLIYQPTGKVLSGIKFDSCWFENNGGVSIDDNRFQLLIDSQTHDFANGPPTKLRFVNCLFNSTGGTQRGMMIHSLRWGNFTDCSWLNGSVTNNISLDTWASYVNFVDRNGGPASLSGGNRCFDSTKDTSGVDGIGGWNFTGHLSAPILEGSWGFMSISNLATHVTLSGSGTYSTITNWDISSLNNFTSSAVNTTGGTLTNTFAGWYRISYSVTCTPGNSDTVEVDVGINGVSSDLIAGHQTASNPAKSVSLAGGGIMFLPANTAVSLRLQNQNSTTISAFDHAQLVIGTP